ncbi:TonB-dependent receptor [Zavarzinia compransoris]|uniref:TonB-dependent siderophore receptor n=1 Tax=Zavarzinia compransoris TaxID=1264899 RepID=A0A317E6K8_9PROT|nr:TonB-dependent receptor [Zavarzinia compransoris]PWR21900.1 TonB-dependent siderophore receptor [Zavarzinia compransoris]TDP47370.1 catecholate siderophore receptor [Zavarzinia compransoris]
MTNATRNTRKPASLRLETAQARTPNLKAGLALGVSALMFAPALALGQQAATPAETETETLPTVDVQGEPNPNAQPGVPYKARTSGDERLVRPLAETPKTIEVITKEAIAESGYTDLRDILDAQPGITVGTGENGNAFGDRYIIRGQEARSDVFVDGLRDPGMTTRESFAIEQLEISKGPDSTFAGRGSAGGQINAVTKQANPAFNFATISTAYGTDDHTRVTVDANQTFGEGFAIRANVLYAYEGVPDRDPAERERYGLALSGFLAFTDDFDITVDYYGLRADENPDLGGLLVSSGNVVLPPAYAQDGDFQTSDVDTMTLRARYRFNESLRLTNLTRHGTSDNDYAVTGMGANAATRYTAAGTPFQSRSLSFHNGWQEVAYFANQTNLFYDTKLAGLTNQFVVSIEYTDHSVINGVYTSTNTGAFNCRSTAGAGALNAHCANNPDGSYVGNLNSLLGRRVDRSGWDSDWGVKTIGISLMDTIDVTDDLSVFLGGRVDRYDYNLKTRNNGTGAVTDYGSVEDTLWNGFLGVTYDVAPGGIVYATVGTAADINGGESDVGTSSGYGGTVTFNGSIGGAKPERSTVIEIGTKWNIFDEKLLLTAAAFQVRKTDVMEGADYASLGTFNTGENEVRGVELGLTGEILPGLEAQAGIAIMRSEVTKSATAANVGWGLANFADVSASAQLRYHVTDALAVGGAVKYEGERSVGQPDTAAVNARVVPDYTVYDLFATYRINRNFNARLNVNNLFDEDYYLAAYRSGAFVYKGDGRQVTLTVDYEF